MLLVYGQKNEKRRNLDKIKKEVPEHSEVTKMQPVDNGQEENMHIVEDMVG